MKRALIFGIGGFVGPYLARELKSNGYEVFGTDTIEEKESFKFDGYFSCNILDSNKVTEIISKVNPTHIINLAAISSVGQSWKMPDITMQVNVNGTLNIFEGCIKANIRPRILLIGSSEEYVISDKPMDENTPLNANNPYGISKIAQEQFANVYKERYGFKAFCVRAFNHTGVGQRDTFVLPSFCKQVAEIEKSGKPGAIYVGNLEASRDFSDVRDIVNAYRLVIESDDDNVIYNVGSGDVYSLNELLRLIISFTKQAVEIKVDKEKFRPVDNPMICCDSSLIRKKLNWSPKYKFSDTLKELFKFYLNEVI